MSSSINLTLIFALWGGLCYAMGMSEQLWTYDGKRFVEWLAVFLAIHHYIPSSAYHRSYANAPEVYRQPRQGGRAVQLNRDDGMTAREDAHADWKRCGECGDSWPPTDDYWHRDSKGRNGLHSLCVHCRCETERSRYRRNLNPDG